MKENIIAQLERLLNDLERMQLEDYLNYVSDRRKLLLNNFLIGIARGLGTALGVAVLGALVIGLLQRLVEVNIPVIGDFLANMVRIVQARLG